MDIFHSHLATCRSNNHAGTGNSKRSALLKALRRVALTTTAIAVLWPLTHTAAAGGLLSPSVFEPYLGGLFSDGKSSGSGGGWTQQDYFPKVKFVEPIRIVEHPTTNKLLVVSKNGKGHLITNQQGATDKTEYFDIQPIMQGNPSYGEGGISDFVFHPQFGTGSGNSSYVYITYWYSPDYSGTFSETGENGYNRLSRFEVINNRVSLSTELVLISQYDRDKFHIAGDMEFGPDGFLYITVGDESNGASKCCNINTSTQRLDGGLWSGVLRIDVDNDPSRSHPIRRQPSHPIADPQVNGSHWPNSFTQGYSIPNDNPFLDPDGGVLEEFYSIGFRGSLYPELAGKYIFTDFVSGKLWTATKNGSRYTIEQIGNVTGGWQDGINSHLIDSSGRILMAKSAGPQHANGSIETLVPVGGVINNEPPALLSQVGAFTDLASKTPVDGCIPYELNVPFWSDGAVKSRWVCVPNDGSHNTAAEKISYSERGIWDFPAGTVFIKHFEMAANTTNPTNTFDLETRFLVRTAKSYNAYTYRWNSTGTDATLDTGGGSTFRFGQRTASGNFTRTWEYPPSINASTVINSTLTATPTTDSRASLEDRARSYLDSNCGYCHQPGGVRANFDARLTTPLASQGIINGPLLEHYGIDGEAVAVPGSPAQSILFHRANQTDNLSMPPLSKGVIDEAGMQLLEQWIISLAPGNDSDGDGIEDSADAFPLDPLNDIDADQISGHIDNCPIDSNPDQADSNNNGLGDLCDSTPVTPSSQFRIVQILNDATGLCIEVENASQADGANVQSGICNDAMHQQIVMKPIGASGDVFNLEFSHSGQCLTVPGDTAGNGPSLV